eukprot:215573_1
MVSILIFIWFYLYIISYAAYETIVGSETSPRAVVNHAIGYDHKNQTILLFGGYDARKQFIKFDTITSQFIDVHTTYLTQDFFGGQLFSQQGDTLWMMNSIGNAFLTINTETYIETDPLVSIPINVGNVQVGNLGCLTIIDGYLFILGGTYDGIDLVQVYNFSSQTWFNAPSLQTPRAAAACLAVRDKLYIIGGRNTIVKHAFDTIEQLDIDQAINSHSNQAQWIYINGTLSEEVHHSGAVQYGDHILVIGGMRSDNTDINEIHLIDTYTGFVHIVGSLAQSTATTAVIIVNGKLYVFGGTWNPNIYQYVTLPTSQPTQPPTINPTANTLHPTVNPTLYPTSNPSTVTLIPTSSPSFHPTSSPSSYPTTLYPTMNPSASPLLFASSSTDRITTKEEVQNTASTDANHVIAEGTQPEQVDIYIIIAGVLSLIGLTICVLLIALYRWYAIWKENKAQMKAMAAQPALQPPQVDCDKDDKVLSGSGKLTLSGGEKGYDNNSNKDKKGEQSLEMEPNAMIEEIEDNISSSSSSFGLYYNDKVEQQTKGTAGVTPDTEK